MKPALLVSLNDSMTFHPCHQSPKSEYVIFFFFFKVIQDFYSQLVSCECCPGFPLLPSFSPSLSLSLLKSLIGSRSTCFNSKNVFFQLDSVYLLMQLSDIQAPKSKTVKATWSGQSYNIQAPELNLLSELSLKLPPTSTSWVASPDQCPQHLCGQLSLVISVIFGWLLLSVWDAR